MLAKVLISTDDLLVRMTDEKGKISWSRIGYFANGKFCGIEESFKHFCMCSELKMFRYFLVVKGL